MPPPEMDDVLPNEVIADEWGNQIRDRTIQRYDDRSTRSSEHSSPDEGDFSYLENENVVEFYDGSGWVGIPPVGSIIMWPYSTAPTGYILLQGQAISRTTYPRLNSLASSDGYPHGNGDGSTTFNLPDLRQRFPLGQADSGTGSTLGSTGGSINHRHSGPSHSHSNPNVNSNGSHTHSQGNTGSGGTHDHALEFSGNVGQFFHTDASGVNRHATDDSELTDAGSHSHSNPNTNSSGNHNHAQGNTGSAGTGNTGSNNPPYLTVNFCVKAG